jgi:hypothetical protein
MLLGNTHLRKLSDTAPNTITKTMYRALFTAISALPPLQGFLKLIITGYTKLKRWC